MFMDCASCVDGMTSANETCTVCAGTGEIDLTDDAFKDIRHGAMLSLTGIVWSALLTDIADIKSKLDALDVKMDTLDSHLDIIEAKIDVL